MAVKIITRTTTIAMNELSTAVTTIATEDTDQSSVTREEAPTAIIQNITDVHALLVKCNKKKGDALHLFQLDSISRKRIYAQKKTQNYKYKQGERQKKNVEEITRKN